ncbi:hypothetical protein K1X13_02260 [Nocardioides sp. WL0053]|uniref:X-X-X-Leu-X-X-Gly heptad repeat protein n=1 Tax=Nocardioides jiangsuensis TaxID=2866161 RepID=A0ABS7RF37_9ACTN|nr:hypothetical protein [Nocardioides jiangsuensis]MBY9073636.1 hypothetical protein [Nocardioides jiangsuensis]
MPLRLAAVTATTTVVCAMVALPASGAEGDVQVTNTETIQVYTDASGAVDTQRVYEQLAMTGNGTVDLQNPIETDGLRNLDGFGGFDVVDGNQVATMTVDGEERVRSVSDYTGDLPLEVTVEYYLDGERVEPGDVVGEDGKLEVKFIVKNVTGADQEITFDDGKGGTVTKTVNVPIPMVGSLTTVAPSTFTDVQSGQANMAGDGKGGTKLSFTMTLFPPLGSDTAEFGYTATITDGVVPRASISALPVNPLESPTFKTAADSYQGGADTGIQLTDGASQIDANLLKLRDGAGELLAGLIKLRDGATKLEAGLAGVAAPGADLLADGAGELSDGLTKIDDGAGKLADGTDQLEGGTQKLADGTGKLDAGAGKLDDGANKLADGAGRLSDGLGEAGAKAPALLDGLGQVQGGLVLVDGGLKKLSVGVGDVRDNPKYKQLLQGLTDLVSGVGSTSAQGSLTWAVDQVRAGLSTKAVPGVQKMQAGVHNAPSAANPEPGAYEKLGCALVVLNDIKAGTIPTGRYPGGKDLCYFDAATNPDALIPPLMPLAAIDGAVDTPAEFQTVTVTKLITQLGDGRNKLYNPANAADLETLYGGLNAVLAGLTSQDPAAPGAIPALSTIECGLDSSSLGGMCEVLRPGKVGVRQGLEQVAAGVPMLVDTVIANVQGAIGTGKDLPADKTLRGGVNGLQDGVTQLQDGGDALLEGLAKLSEGAGQLDVGAGQLADGTGELSAGTGELDAGAQELNDGASRLADGAGQLADGTGKAADGASRVADGAGKLSDGLGDAADGSGQLADGLGQAADGAPKLVDGAQRLSDEGTSKLVDAGESTAQNYGEMYATIAAGAERAQAEKMAYGAPEGAMGLTAYSYEIKGEDGEGGRNLARGVGGLAVLAAGAGAFAFRRRLI